MEKMLLVRRNIDTTTTLLDMAELLQGFPSLIYFTQGLMYKYPAEKEWPRNKEFIMKFATVR